MSMLKRRLVSPEAIELLADTYSAPESGYRRTANGVKASYDGAVLLLGLLDELRQLRAVLGERSRSPGRKISP